MATTFGTSEVNELEGGDGRRPGVCRPGVRGRWRRLGFGLDSLIKLGSAARILWRFTSTRAHSGQAERRAQQLIAGCFAMLALYLAYGAITGLANSPPAQDELGGSRSLHGRDRPHAHARPSQARRRSSARFRRARWRRSAILALRTDCRRRTRQYPRQQNSQLVVARADRRTRHRGHRDPRGTPSMGRGDLRRLHTRRIRQPCQQRQTLDRSNCREQSRARRATPVR